MPHNCKHYDRQIDYASFEKINPVSERACNDEAVWLNQTMLLGTKEDVDDIIGAIKKVQANRNELK
jgi:hypothetical protein